MDHSQRSDISRVPAGKNVGRTSLALRAGALTRDENPIERSVIGTQKLLGLVAEMSPDAALAVTVASGPIGVELGVELWGSAVLWRRDIERALSGCLSLRTRRRRKQTIPAFTETLELVRAEGERAFLADEDDGEYRTRIGYCRSDQRNAGVFPIFRDGGEELIEAMAAHPGITVRTVIGPASWLEHTMIADERAVSNSSERSAETVVRARTFVASLRRPIPPVVRSSLRARGRGLAFDSVSVADATSAWFDPSAAIAGYAVTERAAVALFRVPTAGANGVHGIRTVRPALRPRALDPLPAPAIDGLRLGAAQTAAGKAVDVTMNAADLCRHTFVVGRSGSGKTTYLVSLFRELTQAGYAVTYLDPHGDGARDAAAFTVEPGSPDALFIRHGDADHPVGIDVVGDPDAARRSQHLTALLDLFQDMFDPRGEGIVGPRFKRSMMLVCDAVHLVWAQKASLWIVASVLSETSRIRSLADRVRPLNPELARALVSELANLSDATSADLISWVTSKFQPFIGTPEMRRILGTGVDAVDVLRAIDSDQSLIIDLAMPRLGVESAQLLGALWLLKHWTAMGRRRDRSRPRVILIDEAHLFTFGVIPAMLAEARKFGIGVVVATQSVDRLSRSMMAAVEANCDSVVTMRTGIGGVVEASARLDGWPIAELLRLPDLTAAASISRDGVLTDPFTLTIDHHDRVAAAGWTEARIAHAAESQSFETTERLWAPNRHVVVPTDREVLATLTAEAERSNARASLLRALQASKRGDDLSPALHDDLATDELLELGEGEGAQQLPWPTSTGGGSASST